MSFPRLSPLFFRRIHKWVGLILGLQFILWTLSGAMMALLDAEKVGGHGLARHTQQPAKLPESLASLRSVSNTLGDAPIIGLTLRSLSGSYVYEVRMPDGLHLIDAASGRRVIIDAGQARTIAKTEYAGGGPVRSVSYLAEPTLETREYEGATWRIDFKDADDTSLYVAEATGQIVAHRNNTWRTWDFFWMLHNMDYLERKSFNHPLIVTIAFGVLWLSLTGFYLLFKSFGKGDFRWLTKRKKNALERDKARRARSEGERPTGLPPC